MTSRKHLGPVLAPFLAVALVVAGCSSGEDGPDPKLEAAVATLATALAAGDVAPVEFEAPGAASAYQQLAKPLAAYPSQVTAGAIKESGDSATAELDWTTTVGRVSWTRTTSVELTKTGSEWAVLWKPSILESSLVEGEKLVVTGIKATRGDVIGGDGTALVTPRAVVRFGIDKAQAAEKNPGADLGAAATRLASVLDISPAPLVDAVKKAGAKAFVPALVVRRNEVTSRTLAAVEDIPGGRAISDRLPLAPSRDFAAALLGTVGPATAEIIEKSNGTILAGDDTGLSGLQLRYNDQLAGIGGIKIVAESTSAADSSTEPRVLFSQDPKPGTSIELALDAKLQTKAQQLLTRYGPASGLVAIKPSTGEIVVAASGPGSDGYNTATFGQYPPGSTFKIVSSLALLRSGLTPSSRVTCPATTTVNGKQFKNYSDYPGNRLGEITLRQAVANSCNTAFITARDKIKGSTLADAAAALGFGTDQNVGFPAYFGQVPPPAGETEAAANLIGQGKVLASPMAMAAVMASVVKGSTVVPDLVRGDPAVTAAPAKPLTADEAKSLRTLMRAVVEEGSGAFLQSLGAPGVLAKTGTAEYGDATKTHAWMIGAQGDLAVAVFVETGESGSQTAGPVLADFLRAAQ